MRLHTSQRTQSKALQFALKLSHVMAPYREVVDEIEGALAHQGSNQLKLGTKLLLCCESSAPQFLDAAFCSFKPNRSGNFAFRSLLSLIAGSSTSCELQCVAITITRVIHTRHSLRCTVTALLAIAAFSRSTAAYSQATRRSYRYRPDGIELSSNGHKVHIGPNMSVRDSFAAIAQDEDVPDTE